MADRVPIEEARNHVEQLRLARVGSSCRRALIRSHGSSFYGWLLACVAATISRSVDRLRGEAGAGLGRLPPMMEFGARRYDIVALGH